jgi:exopolysaccharide production protein ExoQ
LRDGVAMSIAFVAVLTAIVMLAALAFAIAALIQYRLAGRISAQWRVAVALLVIGIGAILSVALTSRDLDESILTEGRTVFYSDLAGGFAASRWLSLLLLGAAFVEIIRGALRVRAAGELDPAWPLLAALLLFYLGTLLVQGFLSQHVGFTHKELYLPILLLAVYLQPLRDLESILVAAKTVVLVLLLGSLFGIYLRPDFVLHRPAPDIIPGIDWRLFGLTSHANTLGPVALLGVLLELYAPSRRFWLRALYLGAGVMVFVLAQSRTAWVAALLIAMFVWVPLTLLPRGGVAVDRNGFGRTVWILIGCIGVSIALVCGMVAFGGAEYLQHKTELGTLNGRFQIWDITLEAWRENPLFGYGPEVWGAARQQRFNMFHVGQAHNQFVQTLGEAGLAGLFLLIVYLLALLGAACLRFAASRGLTLALLLLLLSRCVTEAPLRSEGLLSWSSFLHVLLLLVACHHLRQPARPGLVNAHAWSTRARRDFGAGAVSPRLASAPWRRRT